MIWGGASEAGEAGHIVCSLPGVLCAFGVLSLSLEVCAVFKAKKGGWRMSSPSMRTTSRTTRTTRTTTMAMSSSKESKQTPNQQRVEHVMASWKSTATRLSRRARAPQLESGHSWRWHSSLVQTDTVRCRRGG